MHDCVRMINFLEVGLTSELKRINTNIQTRWVVKYLLPSLVFETLAYVILFLHYVCNILFYHLSSCVLQHSPN